MQGTISNGTWIRELSEVGKHVYRCRALLFLGNMKSSYSIVVYMHAYPEVNVTWLELNANGATKLNEWLNFTRMAEIALEITVVLQTTLVGKGTRKGCHCCAV